jgi:hypothetical protein
MTEDYLTQVDAPHDVQRLFNVAQDFLSFSVQEDVQM